MTKTQFKQKAEQMFMTKNPTATIHNWTFGPNHIRRDAGYVGKAGGFLASAPGIPAREVIAHENEHGFGVR